MYLLSLQDIQSSINPKRFKLLLQYEELAVTAITYIIRFLQYTNNEDENYHYDLLNILNILLHNLPPNVLQKCDDFDTGTM